MVVIGGLIAWEMKIGASACKRNIEIGHVMVDRCDTYPYYLDASKQLS
jgi:hypothetical protein